MGNFSTNFTIRSEDQNRIADSLRRLQRDAYVFPPAAANVVVVDDASDSQSFEDIELLGSTLSADLQRPVLAVMNHDDDILYYWLFADGDLIDHYDSTPDYFDFAPPDVDIIAASENYQPAPPQGGDAVRLCAAFECPNNSSDAERILRKSSSEYVFAIERHEALLKALEMSDHALGTAYASFEHGELPDELDVAQCIRIG
jgi:hypothetical protein